MMHALVCCSATGIVIAGTGPDSRPAQAHQNGLRLRQNFCGVLWDRPNSGSAQCEGGSVVRCRRSKDRHSQLAEGCSISKAGTPQEGSVLDIKAVRAWLLSMHGVAIGKTESN